MRFSFLVLLTFITLLSASLARAESLLDIQKVTSDDGIEAWLVEDHSVPVLAIEFSFRHAGSAFDPEDKQGLARMASNTMDEGAGRLDAQDFQKELRDLAITLHFNAGRDHFGGSFKTLTKNKERALELLELSLTKPRFDQEAIDRMREANQSRIRSSLSNPEWIAARLINDKAFEDHPYAMNSGGTLSSLNEISRAYLKQFHKGKIGKNNLVVAAAGDITTEELATLLDDVFGDLPDVEVTPQEELEVQNAGESFVYQYDAPQTFIEIMQPGIDRHDPEYQAAQVMNFILGSSGFGSRLTEEIREKRGLTYGIYSSLYNLDAMDALSISTSTANENVEEMLKLIRAEFTKMIDEPISEKELKDSKSYLIGSLPLSLTSTDKVASLLLSIQLRDLPIDYLDKRKAAIEKATIEDIQNIAKTLLKPDSLSVVMVGDIEAPEGAKEIKELPNVE